MIMFEALLKEIETTQEYLDELTMEKILLDEDFRQLEMEDKVMEEDCTKKKSN